jgi:hypothetical protein
MAIGIIANKTEIIIENQKPVFLMAGVYLG